MRKWWAYLVILLAVFITGVSLMLFFYFLYSGPLYLVYLGLDGSKTLWFDSFLCLFFFVIHSGMIRKSFREWLENFIQSYYHGVIYAISSSIGLLILVIFWQDANQSVVVLKNSASFIPRITFFIAIMGLIWSAHSLRSFDIVGRSPLLAQMYNRQLPATPFAICGPYRWVRHPFYFCMLMIIWSFPSLTLDRFLLNILWSIWIVIATGLEERDLVVSFGLNYRNYQKNVPMLIPWRVLLRMLSVRCREQNDSGR